MAYTSPTVTELATQYVNSAHGQAALLGSEVNLMELLVEVIEYVRDVNGEPLPTPSEEVELTLSVLYNELDRSDSLRPVAEKIVNALTNRGGSH